LSLTINIEVILLRIALSLNFYKKEAVVNAIYVYYVDCNVHAGSMY
jgi:hypothetical protein